jgi:hypothetical protein
MVLDGFGNLIVGVQGDGYSLCRLPPPSGGDATYLVSGLPNAITKVAACAKDGSKIAYWTSDQKLFVTTSATKDATTPAFSEIGHGGLLDPSADVVSMTYTAAGEPVLLFSKSTLQGSGEFIQPSPLLAVIEGNKTWKERGAPRAAGTPTDGHKKVVAHPHADVLFVACRNVVWKVTLQAAGGNVTWEDIGSPSSSTTPLRGVPIKDLWVGQIAPPEGSTSGTRVILRAILSPGGIWEADVSTGSVTTNNPYFCKSVLDPGYSPSTAGDGVPNPYQPSDGLWHYQCPDIKVDALQHQTGSNPFYQTDPEWRLVDGALLPSGLFDQLFDNSDTHAGDKAIVHVKVRTAPPDCSGFGVVVVMFAKAFAGAPPLNARTQSNDTFDFWSQFGIEGNFTANLPLDSAWQLVGDPQRYSVDTGHQTVLSWEWNVPGIAVDDPGHYCVAAFINDANGSFVGETNYNLDELATTHYAVGQKNVHIGPRLPPDSTNPFEPFGASGNGLQVSGQALSEYIEFNNATNTVRTADLVFATQNLPSQLGFSFALTKLDTVGALVDSITGVASSTGETGPDVVEQLRSTSTSDFPDWKLNQNYAVGDMVRYAAASSSSSGAVTRPPRLYKCRIPHVSTTSDWAPTNVPALWASPPPCGITEWAPQSEYKLGALVTHGGAHFKCQQQHFSDAPNWTPENTPALWTKTDSADNALNAEFGTLTAHQCPYECVRCGCSTRCQVKGAHTCDRRTCVGLLGRFEPVVYTSVPGSKDPVVIKNVRIAPAVGAGAAKEPVAAYFKIENKGVLPPGEQYSFHVQQAVQGNVVGGSEYVVRMAGRRERRVDP